MTKDGHQYRNYVKKKKSLKNRFSAFYLCSMDLYCYITKPHSAQDLRTGGRWFDPWLSHCSFRGLMIVIVIGFIPLSLLSIVLTMVTWMGKNIG